MLALEFDAASHAARRRPASGFGDYFRYHGWLSPGVRLFRALNFKAKALAISAAFTAPLILLAYFLCCTGYSQIQSTHSERRGIVYGDAIVKLIKTAQLRRLAATSDPAALPPLQEQERGDFEALAARQTLYGAGFNTAAAFDAALRLHARLQSAAQAGDAAATFVAHCDYIDALLALGRAVADGSQLSLDPDLDTYHMMNIAVLRGPQWFELAARLRGSGMMALKSQALAPAQRDTLVEDQAVQRQLTADVENSYQQGIAPDPAFAARVDIKAIAAAAAAQRDELKRQLLGPRLGQDAARYLELSNAAVNLQRDGIAAVSLELDRRLLLRIDRIMAGLREQIVVSLAGVALATYLLLAFYKVMMGGLREVAGHLEQITRGNLTTAPRPWGSDEAARLMITMGRCSPACGASSPSSSTAPPACGWPARKSRRPRRTCRAAPKTMRPTWRRRRPAWRRSPRRYGTATRRSATPAPSSTTTPAPPNGAAS